MSDLFELSPVAPASRVFAITKADSTALTITTRGIMVCSGAGDVRFCTPGSDFVTLPLQTNQLYPIRATYVTSTGTTATGIFGFA